MAATMILILISVIICSILYFSFSGPGELWDPELESGALSILGRRKDKLLRVLKDLDDEQEMGFIEESEHLQLRRSYKAKAVVALREYERVREARLKRIRSVGANISPESRGRVEKLVARRLRNPAAEEGER